MAGFVALGAAVAALAARRPVELLAFAVAALFLGLLAAVDFAEQRLPDILTLPAFAAVTSCLAVAAWVEGEWPRLGRAGIAAASFLAFYLLAALLVPNGIYFGDVKLSPLLGAYLGWLGWSQVLAGFVFTFLLGGLVSLALLVSRRGGLRSEFPFGPWMILGTYAGALLGPAAFPVFTMI